MQRAFRAWPVAAAILAISACGDKPEAETAGLAAAPEEKSLNVLNWSDYIGDTTVADFERKTGIKVTYDVFDSNEVLETKLLSGRSGYDIVVPTAPFLERQIKAGVFLPLDKSKLPNLVNMDPEIVERVAAHDPGNQHSITYLWGTIGLGYNPELVKRALGTDTIDSWSVLLEPGEREKAREVRHRDPRRADRCFRLGRHLQGPRPEQRKARGPRGRRGDAREGAAVHPLLPFVFLHQ